MRTQEWTPEGVVFDTLRVEGAGVGCLAVDSDDHIYVAYQNVGKIQVFTKNDGNAVREIIVEGYEPLQMSVMEPSKMLVIKTGTNVITIFDQQGNVINTIAVRDHNIYHAVRNDGTILIAAINEERDRVNIDQYTSECEHVKNLVRNQVIHKTERNWYRLREFASGELALCSPDRLYIFN